VVDGFVPEMIVLIEVELYVQDEEGVVVEVVDCRAGELNFDLTEESSKVAEGCRVFRVLSSIFVCLRLPQIWPCVARA
jgi:hypothetical protein